MGIIKYYDVMKKIIIIGSGGFGIEAVWTINEHNKICPSHKKLKIIGFADDDITKTNSIVFGYKVLGKTKDVFKILEG